MLYAVVPVSGIPWFDHFEGVLTLLWCLGVLESPNLTFVTLRETKLNAAFCPVTDNSQLDHCFE